MTRAKKTPQCGQFEIDYVFEPDWNSEEISGPGYPENSDLIGNAH